MAEVMGWFVQLNEFLGRGGFVMWPLAVGTFVLWYALGYRMLSLRRGAGGSLPELLRRARSGELTQPAGILDGAVLLGLACLEGAPSGLRSRLDEAFGVFDEELDRYALWVKIIVVLAPLAGLLGTVAGMIETFDSLGDMALFTQSGGIAGGVAQALITTQMGLAVAIPGLLVGQLLERKQDYLSAHLEQLKELLCLSVGATVDEEPSEERSTSMRFSRRKKREETGVDISPLIDMVFILLIFFMVTTTFVKDLKLELERPSAKSASRASTKAVRVHLERGGAIYVDGLSVKIWMLQSRVRDALKSGAARPVLVITDRLVQAQKLIEVVDQCRLAGAKDVGVATTREAG